MYTKTIILSSLIAVSAFAAEETPSKPVATTEPDATLLDLFAETEAKAAEAEDVAILSVDGEKIMQSELDEAIAPSMMQLQMMGGSLPPEQLQAYAMQMQQQALSEMIQKILLEKAIVAEEIEVTSDEVDEEIERQKKLIVEEGTTLEAIMEQRDMTLDDVKKDVKFNLEVEKLYEKKTEGVEATKEEANEVYDTSIKPSTVTCSHLLLSIRELVSEEDKAAQKEEIEKIRKDILDGTISFDEAVKKHGEDPGLEQNGWQYTGVKKGDMVPEFDAAIFSQEVGEVGEVVETSYGYHIIKVIDREPVKKDFEELTEDELKELIDELTPQKKNQEMSKYVKELMEKADIKELL